MSKELTDESFIQDFYSRYLALLVRRPPRLDVRDAIAQMRDSLAPAFFRHIVAGFDDFDADPFLDAQDYDAGWQQHLKVTREADRPDAVYLVCFGIQGEMRHSVRVLLVDLNGRRAVGAVQHVEKTLCNQLEKS